MLRESTPPLLCVPSAHSAPSAYLLFVTLSLAAIITTLAGCSTNSSTRAKPDSPTNTSAPASTTAASAPIVESVEPWTYNGTPGRLIRTAHYRVFTTQPDTVLNDRVPLFIEDALNEYRTSLSKPGQPLPEPELKLDTYILRTRADWALLTRQLTGEQAELYLRIPRGGFAFGGKALLFDIGTRDTLAILAHEGWHQYTQRAFRQPLPIWLEEGIATYMEGHRWGGAGGGTPQFLPWCNVERFDQLRRAEAQKRLLPLDKLLESAPQDLMNRYTDDALIYYAQVWALTHFLAEGADGKYRAGLADLLADAAAGTADRRIGAVLGPAYANRILMNRRGQGVFLAYFNQDIAEAAREYEAFVAELVQSGSRGAIVEGRSPLGGTAAEE